MASSLLFPPPSHSLSPLDPSSSFSFRPLAPPKPSPPFSLSSFFGDPPLPHRPPLLSLRKDPPPHPPARLSSSLRDPLPGIDDSPASWHVDASRVFLPSDSTRPSSSQTTTAVATAEYAVAEEEMDMVGYRKASAAAVDGQGRLLFPRADASGIVLGEQRKEEQNDEQLGGMEVSQLGLNDELVSTLLKRGISRLFPIQEAVLEPAMEGRDIIGRAKTGTGKTLAFGIPIIQHLLEENENKLARRIGRTPRALVLAPTRELAVQVEKEFMESAPRLSTICVYGGVSILAQQRKLVKGVDVAVGTPGRIIDLLERGSLNLKDVRYIVLDEADQMLAVGFEEDVEKILEELPIERQSMLFSATMPAWVKKLSRKFLDNPLTIDLVGNSDEKLAEGIKMFAVSTVNSAKRSILSDLITVYGKGGKTIVFTQTKKDADEVSLSMSRMLGTEALHGDITQAQREKTLNGFRSGKFTVLVATDVAARGLDIPNVDLVIHYEIPNDPETFVHRSGRTGRAGKHGTTILIHTEQQIRNVRLIERDVGCKFECISPPSLLDVLQSSSQQAEEVLSKVHPDLRNVFLPTAERLLEEQGPEALAAAIAQLSGFTQPPPSRSLITHEQGWMTLQMSRFGQGRGLRSISARNVLGALSEIFPLAADVVGKIRILDEREVEGAIFDLPEEVAKELLTKELQPGISITTVTKLPRLVANEPQERFGRFPSRGSGGSGGRSDWVGKGRRQNERSSGWQSDQSRGKFQDFDRVSRSRSSPKDRVFSGACFICGGAGHRAAECPDSRRR